MRLANWHCARRDTDAGSAIVETVFLGVLLLLPLVYALLTAFSLQRAAFGLTAGVREAGRAFATAPDDATAQEGAQQALRIALIDQGVSADRVELTVQCEGTDLCGPGSRATVAARTRVPLPWLPALSRGPAGITVAAEHRIVVDSYVERQR